MLVISAMSTDTHRESVSGWGGFSLGVLIASCTANSNLEYKTPKRCVRHPPKPLAVVKWYKINAFWYKPDPLSLGGS